MDQMTHLLPVGPLAAKLAALVRSDNVQDIDGNLVRPPALELLLQIQTMLDECHPVLGSWHLEPGGWQGVPTAETYL